MALKVGELFAELKIEDQGADQKLKAAESGLKGVEQQAGRTESRLGRLGGMFSNIGKLAAAGFAAGVAGAVALGGALTAVTASTAKHADEVAKTSRRVGVSAEAYQELEYALGQAGLEQDQLNKLLERNTQRMGMAIEGNEKYANTYADLGVAITDVNGNLRASEDVFDDIMISLAGIEDDSLRSAKASELLGQRAGPQLAGLLKEGTEGIDAARERAHELGIVLGDETLANAEKFNDAWDDVKRQMQGMVHQIGGQLLPVFTEQLFPFLNNTAMPVLRNLAEHLGPIIDQAIIIGTQAIQRFIDAFGQVMGTARAFRGWVQGILNDGDVLNRFLLDLPGWFQNMVMRIHNMMNVGGQNAILSYAQGIIDGAAVYVTQAVNFVADLVSAYLVGQSPPKRGPLREIQRGGRRTMEAYSEGLVEGAEGASQAAEVVSARLDAVNESAELQAGRAGLDAATGNLEAMERVADDVDRKLGEINRSIQGIELEISGIDREIQAINDVYDDQLRPLEEQLDLLEKQRDLQSERLQLETELQQAQLNAAKLAALGDPERRAEIAGEMELLDIEQERLRLDEQIAKTRAQLEGGGEELSDADREQLELKERQLELSRAETQERLRGDKELTDLEKERLQLRLDQIDADLRSNRAKQEAEPEELTDQERHRLELQLQELELRKELADMIDAEATAQAEADSQLIDSREKEKALTEEIADIQRDIARIPIEEEIAKVEEARRAELEPLEAQRDLLEQQKDDLAFQRQQWQLLSSDVNTALTPLQEAAREAERLAQELERAEKAAEGLSKKAGGGAGGTGAKGFDESPEAMAARLAGLDSCPPGFIMLEDGSCKPESAYAEGEIDERGLSRHAPIGTTGGAGDGLKVPSTSGGGGAAGAGGGLDVPEILSLGDEGVITAPDVEPGELDIPDMPDVVGDSSVAEPMGEKFGGQFADGFLDRARELLRENFGRILGASIGAGVTALIPGIGPMLAPVGAVIGGFIGGMVQDAFGERDIDFSAIGESLRESVQPAIDVVMPTLQRFTDWLMGDGVEGAQTFGDTVSNIFDNYIMPALSRMASDILPAFTEAWERIEPTIRPALENVSRLIQWIGEFIEEHMDTILSVVEPIWEAIAFVITEAISRISQAITMILQLIGGDWEGAWDTAKEFLSDTWSMMTTIVETAVELVIRFITDAVPVIWEKLKEWGAAFVGWLGPQIGPLLSELGALLVRIGNWIINTGLPALRAKLLEWGAAFIAWVKPQIPKLIREAEALNTRLTTWIVETAAPAIVKSLLKWAAAFLDWIRDSVLPYLIRRAEEITTDLLSWIVNTALPEIKDKLLEWAAAFLDWIAEDVLPYLIGKAEEITKALLSWIVDDALPGIKEKLLEWASAFLDWIKDDVLPDLPDRLGEILSTLSTWVTESVSDVKETMKKIGVGIVEGIWQGIKDNASWLKGKLTDWVDDSIPGPVKKALELLSPSRVMARIGAQTAQGLMVGLDDEQSALLQKSRNLAEIMMHGIQDIASDIRIPALEVPAPQLAMAGSSDAGAAMQGQIRDMLNSMREMNVSSGMQPAREIHAHLDFGGELRTVIIDTMTGEMRRR